MSTIDLRLGDCLEVLPGLAENSVDSIITDPPYGLEFMGKDWDHGIPGVHFWVEALRVAKPGAFLLAFGGTRTWHRLAVAVEDAGWEIRDTLMWLYGSGFPKSHDLSKAIDRMAGAEREVVGSKLGQPGYSIAPEQAKRAIYGWAKSGSDPEMECAITAPATPAARDWAGWGTALKPAWEPVIVAMKPVDGTFAGNALAWGVAGLNIDKCRIEAGERPLRENNGSGVIWAGSKGSEWAVGTTTTGRWPANLILDEESAALLDEVTRIAP